MVLPFVVDQLSFVLHGKVPEEAFDQCDVAVTVKAIEDGQQTVGD